MFKNKKGFTLIEMMVVIAIIAVLVSIIIPVVGSATTKAAAATNAANLRGVAGQVTSSKLLGEFTINDGTYTYFAENEVLDVLGNIPAPDAEECLDCAGKTPMRVRIEEDGSTTATYDGYTVEYFAYIAENGVAPDDWDKAPADKLMDSIQDAQAKLDFVNKNLNPATKEVLDWMLSLGDTSLDEITQGVNDLMQQAGGQLNDTQASQMQGTADNLNDILDQIELCSCTDGGKNCSGGLLGIGAKGCGHSHTSGKMCGSLLY